MIKVLAVFSLQYASAGNNPGIPIVFLVGGLSLFFGGLIKINRDRLIANMPTSKIRSVAMGLTEINGKVTKYRDTLTAPLSGKECVYCRLSITEWRRGRKRSYPVELRAKEKGVLFNLDDGTGSILIDARGANLENLTRSIDIESRQGESTITDTILEYCKQRGIELYRKNGTLKNIEFKETHIPVGQDLYIMGIASKNKYKDPASKSEQNDNMIGYQFRQRIFYISDKSEKEILTNSVQNSRIMLIGGMVLSVIGLIGVMDFFK